MLDQQDYLNALGIRRWVRKDTIQKRVMVWLDDVNNLNDAMRGLLGNMMRYLGVGMQEVEVAPVGTTATGKMLLVFGDATSDDKHINLPELQQMLTNPRMKKDGYCRLKSIFSLINAN